ncbi:MAG: hypothetical protein DRP90_03050 [Planctomycetota bacterium]|nr:MAG: hypothetical protein DRP90_03050 [Planctomycetota bacterium]
MTRNKIVFALCSLGGLALIIMYLTGVFTPGRIHPGKHPGPVGEHWKGGAGYTVAAEPLTEYYYGVGTVRSVTQSMISGQVNGTVIEVFVGDGDRVKKGQKLLKIDDREYMTMLREAEKGLEMAKVRSQQAAQMLLQAQAQHQQALTGKRVAELARAQALQGLTAAEENYRRAEADFRRIEKLFASGSVSEQQYDAMKAAWVAAKAQAEQAKLAVRTAEDGIKQAEEAVKAAQAGVAQARSGVEAAELGVKQAEQVVERARIALSYTEVKAPADGFIGQTFVDPGDLVYPGKPLVDFYSKGGFEVSTLVREALFTKVEIGDEYDVVVDALDLKLKGKVTEIVPSADPMSRTFMVKVAVEGDEKLFPGMFARVAIPVAVHDAVFVPSSAVRRVGMLTMVRAKEGGFAVMRYVKLGRSFGDKVEVLSGLKPGDVVDAGGKE